MFNYGFKKKLNDKKEKFLKLVSDEKTDTIKGDKARIMASKSRLLSKALRHDPVDILGVETDAYGYVPVSVVLEKLKISLDELQVIHDTNEKRRFEFNPDKTKIRATQGHSIPVIFDLEFIEPPIVLYHRTHKIFLEKIFETGLLKMNRHHVHMTEDMFLNKTKEILLVIDSKKMHEDGYKFLKTSNDVWLTDFVPPQYITKKDIQWKVIL